MPRAKPGGCFRVEERDGVWWLRDPAGYATLSLATDHVNYEAHWCESLGYAPYHRNVEKKFGGEAAWAADAVKRLASWGFTALGVNASPAARHLGLPYHVLLGLGSEFAARSAITPATGWTGFPDVFDPAYKGFCAEKARAECAPLRGDPWLIGYALDNELEWWGKDDKPWGLALDAWRLPADRPAKAALAAAIKRAYHGDLRAFQEDFGVRLARFADLLDSRSPAAPRSERGMAALMAFVADVAERYFKTEAEAVRRYDPDHLLLGCRFAGHAPDPAYAACGRWCDAVTVNTYPRADLARGRILGLAVPWPARYRIARRPWLVTEWSFPALDAKDSREIALPSLHGAGMRVDTQAQRARCYAIMQRELFRFPFVIGSHYFMWADEPAPGISKAFPEDSNYGLVSEADDPYAALTAEAGRVNPLLAAYHAGRGDVTLSPAEAAPSAFAPRAEAEMTWTVTGRTFVLENGPLRLEQDGLAGNAVDRVSLRDGNRWKLLGRFHPLFHREVAGKTGWPAPDGVGDLRVTEAGPRRVVLDLVLTRSASGEPALACGWRLTVESGKPYFRARCLWIENASSTTWSLAGYFHYAVPGSDRPRPAPIPPDYWLQCAAWTDSATGTAYGVVVPAAADNFWVGFWTDASGAHADCLRYLDAELKPGARWTPPADEPDVAVFGATLTTAEPRPWRSIAAEL